MNYNKRTKGKCIRSGAGNDSLLEEGTCTRGLIIDRPLLLRGCLTRD